jgi:hypothetical protein
MERALIGLLCIGGPHSRFVGGEPPNWRVQVCLFHVDHADKHERRRTEAHDLRELAQCPDEPRRARLTGAA